MPGSPTSITILPRPDIISSTEDFSSSSCCRLPTNGLLSTPSIEIDSSSGSSGEETAIAPAIMASRAAFTSSADSGRCAGSLESIRSMSASSGLGHSGLCHVGATAAVLMCCPMIATGLSPVNGGLPVTISYIIAPREYRSLRTVISPPIACSGDIYHGVPRMTS